MRVEIFKRINHDEFERVHHIKNKNAKALVTSFEGMWKQTEYPIVDVVSKEISSKTLFHMKDLPEKKLEVAVLVFSKNFENEDKKRLIERTLTVQQVLDKLDAFNNDCYVICEEEETIESDARTFHIECINTYMSDNYDMRCANINNLFDGYNTQAFYA